MDCHGGPRRQRVLRRRGRRHHARRLIPSADPQKDADLALVRLAARNNAEWCDIFCRSHGVAGTFHADAWASTRRTPARYPDAVALDPSLSGERILSYVDRSSGCSIKDSFAIMDLSGTGFRVMFEADWIIHAAEPAPATEQIGLEWQRVEEASMLRRWETAWSGDEAPTASFLPALLGHPDMVMLSGYASNQLVAGAIINRSASVVGLSNVFSCTAELTQAYAGCLAQVANYFPGMPIVGYETGVALAAAQAQGFRSIGKLIVWLND